ncbi:hypothetical protein NYE54_28615 [Paenibacillus sp. FSL K6-1330]
MEHIVRTIRLTKAFQGQEVVSILLAVLGIVVGYMVIRKIDQIDIR